MDIIIILILLVALAQTAQRWGANSTENINSPEWERRQYWNGIH